MSSEEGWTVVTRRRRPQHFSPSHLSPPRRTTALSPLTLTYAQVVQTIPKPIHPPNITKPTQGQTRTNLQIAPTMAGTARQNAPNAARHNAPDTGLTYIQSPHSPTMLRYPPNPHFKEWWGRCFRCAKRGHVVAECQQPKGCLSPTHRPMQPPLNPSATPRLNPSAPPFAPQSSRSQMNSQTTKRPRSEPSFEEFLGQPEPHQEPQMPSNRPRKMRYYFNRDADYYKTLEKTLRGIVVHPPRQPNACLSLDQAAEAVAASTLVTPAQLQVARLSRRRLLVLLPPTLDRDEVVSAIPKDVWDQGLTFHSYSPLTDTSISIPFYKLWIDIEGVPLELHQEAHIARAVSSFGLYLGSMEPKTPGDCYTWSVFIATDDLALVPHELEFNIGGMLYTATIHPRNWMKGQVFQRQDLPPTLIAFNPPTSLQPPSGQNLSDPSDQAWSEDDDVFPMSLTALREIFRDVDHSSLPTDLAQCLACNKEAIEANHAAYRQWENRREDNRVLTHFTKRTMTMAAVDPSPSTATADPPSTPLPQPDPLASEAPSAAHGSGKPHHQPQTTPDNTLATVPSTASLQPPLIEDPALQLCAVQPSPVQQGHKSSWDPHILFPEIVSSTSPNVAVTSVPPPQIDTSPKEPTPHAASNQLPPSLRIRTEQNQKGQSAIVAIDANEFVDIPLQLAEGREILSLIGAAAVPIPPHLMASSKPIPSTKHVGQSSKSQPKSALPPQPKKNMRPIPSARKGKKSTLPPLPKSIISRTRPTIRQAVSTANEISQAPQVLVPTPTPQVLVPTLTPPPDNNVADTADDPYLDRVDYSDEEDYSF